MPETPLPPEYQPSVLDKTRSEVGKRAPFIIGRFIQMVMYAVFQAARFIIQMFKDATSR